jgi:transcriptional regulator with XRE-family HTH domain
MLGKGIQTIRKAKSMKQKDLAFQLGISQNAMNAIEANTSIPTRTTLKKICKFLGVPEALIILKSVEDLKSELPYEKQLAFGLLYNALVDLLENEHKPNK